MEKPEKKVKISTKSIRMKRYRQTHQANSAKYDKMKKKIEKKTGKKNDRRRKND